jgi:hypothetical protein
MSSPSLIVGAAHLFRLAAAMLAERGVGGERVNRRGRADRVPTPGEWW